MPVIDKPRTVRRGRPRNPRDPLIAARIRSLREAKGMTQAELAGSDFTKGYISLVETRRAGLSLHAARTLAPKLGISVDELLRPERVSSDRGLELALAKAEADLAAGRHEDALADVKGLAKTARQDLHARRLRVEGRVLLARDRAQKAVPILANAVRLFREDRRYDLAARTLFDLAQAHARSEEPGEAVTCALQCENAIAAGEIIDATLELDLLSFLAGLFVTMGDLTSADLRLERARNLAEDIADPYWVANVYFHLAVARQREEDPEAALRFAMKALDAYEHLGVPAHVGNAWNTIGWIHVQRRQFTQAAKALSMAADLAAQSRDDRLAAYVLQNQAELALAKGEAKAAVSLAQESISRPGASARGRALSMLVKAQALAASDAKTEVVDRAFADAAAALTPFGRELVARAHRTHFSALVRDGRDREASIAAEAAFAALKLPGG